MQLTRRTFLGFAVTGGLTLGGMPSRPGGAQTTAPGAGAAGTGPGLEILRPGKPYRGTTLNFISLNYTYSQGLKQIVAAFQEATGITVNFELLGTLDNLQKQRIELSTGSSAFDIYQVPPFNRAEYHKAGWLAPLDAFLGDERLTPKSWDVADFFPVSLAEGVYKGVRYDLPIFSATIVLYYRRDVFDRLGIKSPPGTFDELLEVCRTIKRQGGDIAPIGLRGAAGPEANMWPFPILLYAYGGKFFRDFPRDMHPALTDPGTVKAVEVWATLVREYGFPGAVNATHEELIVTMQQGKVAMVLDGHPLAGVFLHPEKSQAYGKTGVAPVPGGPAGRFPAFSEHGIAIAKNAKNKEAAWEFLKWATSKGALLEVALKTPYVAATRRSVVDHPKYREKYNYADGQFLNVTREMLEARAPTYLPPVPEWNELADIIGNAVSKATLGQLSPAEAMQRAQTEVDRAMRRAGYY
jgi:ABC-type glycerol-3-phosphate transport system substrate-binding protein